MVPFLSGKILSTLGRYSLWVVASDAQQAIGERVEEGSIGMCGVADDLGLLFAIARNRPHCPVTVLTAQPRRGWHVVCISTNAFRITSAV
ncbi:hypothetical protein [Caballeronia cordobensis]|uniref:hypothetical protein n=1 Tax=Caballeronia cordobensis TaxID=1353886 RepID=UPI000B2451C5|nr:hypothetical protein [Caballeronia cordobensis]